MPGPPEGPFEEEKQELCLGGKLSLGGMGYSCRDRAPPEKGSVGGVGLVGPSISCLGAGTILGVREKWAP